MPERKRNIQLHFMVSESERAQIRENMKRLKTRNMGAYLRKMALSGVWVELDLSDLKEIVGLLRRSSANLNQYVKRAHETGSIYEADIEDLRNDYKELWTMIGELYTRLATIE